MATYVEICRLAHCSVQVSIKLLLILLIERLDDPHEALESFWLVQNVVQMFELVAEKFRISDPIGNNFLSNRCLHQYQELFQVAFLKV